MTNSDIYILSSIYIMKLKRLKKSTDNDFHQAWELYNDAFPLEERRTLDGQKRVLKRSNYHFEILIDHNQFIGFILWWDLEMFRYIDHFATSKSIRNKGFGKLILNTFINNDDKSILLEVELPASSIDQRRINFYERLGFKLNLHDYKVPSSVDNRKIDLLVMSYPEAISKETLNRFIINNHPIIFNS